MNRRLAALYRDRARAARALADVDERIADVLEGEEPANDAAPSEPRVKRRRRRPMQIVKPTGRVKPTQIDMARADALLKGHYGR